MTETLKPASEDQVLDAIRWAVAEERPLELVGRGSKRGFGRPVQAAHALDLSGLAGIEVYEPEELVLTARAGTSMAEIEAALTARGQALAFEPADLGPLYGGPAGAGTLGGVVGCNLSGPRRIKAGAARDHVLGIEAVSGRGQAFKSGGRVVKNVTGYDLPKLLTGAFGTLAAMTRITVKVLPAPETVRTLAVAGLDDRAGVAMLTRALTSPYEVSGAAHLPAGMLGESARSLIRIEGFGPSVDSRVAALSALLGDAGPLSVLDPGESVDLWRGIRDAAPFVGDGRAVWRVSVAPNAGPQVAAAAGGAYYFDWGGGLVWIATTPEGDAGAAAIRAAVAAAGGGHATLVRAPAGLRAAVPVFEPQPPALEALNRRVRDAFDPRGILSPGRMTA
ncbi:glycolate oxidase FAD binding subunit [Inquilinus ginsengisoli]|uniref:Glycolate oxidase FAD binding subunit n=1 Tax=Inquilinus ginsengisoli TaxID=363840 RepID=A0ABU1JTV6_9PROT|nr:glycolate oxidase subunit GlcE [Inquilinus ginsengisoli]MDR6292037.1 glycolate oxidase FAD binding subunit [Inquilinus ginsengisoli]